MKKDSVICNEWQVENFVLDKTVQGKGTLKQNED